MPVDVKICGLTTADAVAAAVDGGARYVGFVSFPPSPRALTPAEAALLTAAVPASVTRVALTVDANDALLDAIVAEAGVDMLQFHGDEPPERVAEIRDRHGLPVMKAAAIASADDIARARAYEDVVDRLLFDARPPVGATRPGGNALAFDWELIRGEAWAVPWMLAGGITADNVAEAVRTSGARAVDVSSGVEDAPGVKNPARIAAFLRLAATL